MTEVLAKTNIGPYPINLKIHNGFDIDKTTGFAKDVLEICYGDGSVGCQRTIQHTSKMPALLAKTLPRFDDANIDINCFAAIEIGTSPLFVPLFFPVFARAPQDVMWAYYRNERTDFSLGFQQDYEQGWLTKFLCFQSRSSMRPDVSANMEAFRLAYSIPESAANVFQVRNEIVVPFQCIPRQMPFTNIAKEFSEQRIQAIAAPFKDKIISELKEVAAEVCSRSWQPDSVRNLLNSEIDKKAAEILLPPTRTSGTEIDVDRLTKEIDRVPQSDIAISCFAQARKIWEGAISEILDTKNVVPLRKNVVSDWGWMVLRERFLPYSKLKSSNALVC